MGEYERGHQSERSPLGWLGRRRARRAYEAQLDKYEAAVSVWRKQVEQLDDALRVVEAGSIEPDPESRIRLQPGERLQYEIRGVQLLETRLRPAHTMSHHAEFGIPPLNVGVGVSRTQGTIPSDHSTVLDVGRVIITDRRAAFAGPKHAREWLFDELISVECPPRDDTVYLPITSRRETSGFRFRSSLHWRVVARLEIGLALHSGDWRVVDGWRRAHAQLLTEQPQSPVVPPGVRVDTMARRRAQSAQQRSGISLGSGPAPRARPRVVPAWGLLGRRVVARLIDAVLVSVFLSYALFVLPSSAGTGLRTGLAVAVVLFLYEVRPIKKRGRTIGKRVVRLVVVDTSTGRNPDLWRSVLRVLVAGILVLTVVGPVIELFRLSTGRVDRPIHDRAVGTSVVALTR